MKSFKKKPLRMPFPKWIIEKFKSFRWRNWFLYCVNLFVIGRIIDHKTKFVFQYFIIHQLLLIMATTLLVRAMRTFFNEVYSFQIESKQKLLSKTPELRGIFEKRFLPLLENKWTFLIAILITTFFFTCIVLVEYIKIDVIGIYAIYIAGSSVLIGVYGYMQYIYFLWFIYRASKCSYMRDTYNLLMPAQTKWVSQLAKVSQNLRNYFLLIGLIYVIEYSILIPKDKIKIVGDSISVNIPNNTAFFVSWVALFLLVIIAFPVINYLQRNLISQLISNLKGQTVNELSQMMMEEQSRNKYKQERMFSIISYSTMIDSVWKSKDYPINRHISYETIMTLVTFVVHAVNLYSKIASVSSLPSF